MTATAIPAQKAAGLFRWNAALALLHLLQGIAIMAISFAKDPVVTSPVVGTYLRYDTDARTLVTAQRGIWDMPIGPAVAIFFFMSALAHFSMAFLIRRRYEGWLARGLNPIRWVEYSFSSSVMIVVIAALAGVQEVGTLIAIFGVNACMILFGALQEKYEEPGKPSWIPFWFGCFAGIIPWIAIAIYVWAPGLSVSPPGFVYGIIASLFVFFNCFAINMVLQYKQVGPWRDYLFGEKIYILLSLTAKALLAWQVFFPVLASSQF